MLNALSDLPRAVVATDAEALHLIDRHALFGCCAGDVDVRLLGAVALTAGAQLWTRDKRLQVLAVKLGLATTALI